MEFGVREECFLIWNAERRKRSGVLTEKINCGGFNSGVQEKLWRLTRTEKGKEVTRQQFLLNGLINSFSAKYAQRDNNYGHGERILN